MESHSTHSAEEKVTQKLGQDDRFEIRLGEELLKRGYLTQQQLGQAMWERSESPLRLQEICLMNEWATKEQIYTLIPTQQLRLGEILLLHGEISLDQLQSVLSSQENRRPRRPLGELIVQQGWIPSERLKWALAEQEELHRLAASNSWQMINGGSAVSPIQRQSDGRETLQELKDAIAGYKHQISVLERQLAAREQGTTAATSLLPAAERQRYEDRIRELEAQVNQGSLATPERQQYEEQIKGLERQLTESRQLKDQLVTGYEARITMLDQQLAQQRQEWETFCSQSNQEIASYHTQYQQQIQWRDLQLQQQAQQQQELQQSLVSLQFELQTAQETLQEHQQQSQSQLTEAQDQIQDLQASLTQLQKEMQGVQQQREAARVEADQLREQIETFQAQIDKVQQSKARLISDLAETRRHKLELEEQVQHYASSPAVQRVQELEQELEQQRQENQTLQQQSQVERTTLSQRLRHLQEEINRLKAQDQAQKIREGLSSQPVPIPPSTPVEAGTWVPGQGKGSSQTPKTPDHSPAPRAPSLGQNWVGSRKDKQGASWAQRLLARLRLAGLVGRADIPQILSTWDRSQEEFTQVLSRCTGLKPETVRFFAEEGYSARLKGARGPEDFLEAAGLVSPEQLASIRSELDSPETLCQTLVKRGILSQVTVDYFSRTFNRPRDPQSTRQPSD